MIDRVIEESDQSKISDLWCLTTYSARPFVDKDTNEIVIPMDKDKCRIHFGKDFEQWKDDLNYLFYVCAYASHTCKKPPIIIDRHKVGTKVCKLIKHRMKGCGRIVGGHFVTLLSILGFLPIHLKDCKRADKATPQVTYFDKKCQQDAGVPQSQVTSLGICKSQPELDKFMQRTSEALTIKIGKKVTEGRIKQVLCKLFQEHVSKSNYHEIYLTDQVFVKTDDLKDPNNGIKLLLHLSEIIPVSTPSLFGDQIPYGAKYDTFGSFIACLASKAIFPKELKEADIVGNLNLKGLLTMRKLLATAT